MEFILDFQGFKSEKNKFIVKELALISGDGHLYELQLFQPPCSFNQLSDEKKKEVLWLEKTYHGFYWGSGFKPYSEMKDIFETMKISGKVFVKGVEKKRFVEELLTGFDVQVINLEDMGCPSLAVLKQKMTPLQMKACSFTHNSKNCAYINTYVLLEWLRFEKYADSRLESVNLAIKECFGKGYRSLHADLIKFLPKDFILNYKEDVDIIYAHLSDSLKNDADILMHLRCYEHYPLNLPICTSWDGPNPRRKNCPFCLAKKTVCSKFIDSKV